MKPRKEIIKGLLKLTFENKINNTRNKNMKFNLVSFFKLLTLNVPASAPIKNCEVLVKGL
jgi:hypothetical protein